MICYVLWYHKTCRNYLSVLLIFWHLKKDIFTEKFSLQCYLPQMWLRITDYWKSYFKQQFPVNKSCSHPPPLISWDLHLTSLCTRTVALSFHEGVSAASDFMKKWFSGSITSSLKGGSTETNCCSVDILSEFFSSQMSVMFSNSQYKSVLE